MCVDPMGRPRAGGLRVSAILSSELNSLIEDGGPAWASECPVLGCDLNRSTQHMR